MRFCPGDIIINHDANFGIAFKVTAIKDVTWYCMKATNGTGSAEALILDVDKPFSLIQEPNDILKGML